MVPQDYQRETRMDMYQCGRGDRTRLQISVVFTLLQAFDEVEIGEQAPVAVNV